MVASPDPPGSRSHGFTLVELMITLAVIGILAAIAYPSFIEAVRKSRRADAVSALSRVQQAQERWRGNNGTYAGELGAGGLNVGATSPDGYYTLAISNNDALRYTVRATAKAGSPQAADTRCRVLQIHMDDVRGLVEYASENAAGDLTKGSNNPCWAR